MAVTATTPIQSFLPTCSTAIAKEAFADQGLPPSFGAADIVSHGASLLLDVYSVGLSYIREHAVDIGMGVASAHAFDKLSAKNAKLLFHGSKHGENITKQFQGKFKKSTSKAVSTALASDVTSPSEFAQELREANVSFKSNRLIGKILCQTNEVAQLQIERNALTNLDDLSLKDKEKIKIIDSKLEKHHESLSWKVAKFGFTLVLELSYDEKTVKLAKELGTFIFWGKGKPLKNFNAFRQALVKSGAIAELKKGNLVEAIEKIDAKTVSTASKAGIDMTTYLCAGLKAASLLGAEISEPLTNSAGNLLMSWKLGSLLWDSSVAETPQEERSWFVRLFTDHYHSARNERANRLLTRNINPYR